MPFRKIHFRFQSWLLVYALLATGDPRVLGGPASVSRAPREQFFTSMIFHGLGHRYGKAPISMPSVKAGDDFTTPGRGPDDERYPWKQNIVTTVFWIGEEAARSNPVPNTQSAWDFCWGRHYGGYDNPTKRANFIPARFIPNQNPFYIALPYNDVSRNRTKAEAALVIPWFKNSFVRDGQSVCKDRWLAIRHRNRTCYAQWEDVGPFRVDHWQYVFGNERPYPNRNHGAGLDVSPAVRDYLGISGMDVCDWKFVDLHEVPDGPWALYGDNNTVAQLRRRGMTAIAEK